MVSSLRLPYAGHVPWVGVFFVLLWNSGFIGTEYGLPYAGPFTLMFWRYLALTLLLGGALAAWGRLRWPGWRAAATAGGIGILAHGVWLTCVAVAQDAGTPAGILALVTSLQPLLTGALAGRVTGEPTGARQWIGLTLGFAGVALAVGARITLDATTPAWAYALPFGSVVGITVASLVQRRLERAGSTRLLAGAQGLLYQSAATALALLPLAVLVEHLATDWTVPFVATQAWLVVAVSLGAYAAMWVLLGRHDATRVASLFYLSPPVTMVMAWVTLGDVVTRMDLMGLVVGAAGVLLVLLPRRTAR